MNYDKILKALKRRGFAPSLYQTRKEARESIGSEIAAGLTVGVGGSVTVREIGLLEALEKKGCNVLNSDILPPEEKMRVRYQALSSDVYLTSCNAITEDGEIVNIDGRGNRVAATSFGPKVTYFITGRNKICPDLPAALHRAKHIAAPLNCKRLETKTPCAITGKCADCASPDRICRVTTIHDMPPMGMDVRVCIIDEDLGF